jgi:hypothetical protein
MHVRTARAAVQRQLDDLIWRHRQQIEFLAGRLMRRERITAADLGELVHKYRSPLSMFRKVTPKPEPVAVMQRGRTGPMDLSKFGVTLQDLLRMAVIVRRLACWECADARARRKADAGTYPGGPARSRVRVRPVQRRR